MHEFDDIPARDWAKRHGVPAFLSNLALEVTEYSITALWPCGEYIYYMVVTDDMATWWIDVKEVDYEAIHSHEAEMAKTFPPKHDGPVLKPIRDTDYV